jgi:hypothetical protein
MSRVNIIFSFDTTGSMYPCLSEVRRKVKETVGVLFTEMPDLKIGIVAHGDYCDKNRPYITKHFPLSSDVKAIQNFVEKVEPTSGGDLPECYEMVFYEVKSSNWDADAEIKILVMIADDVPHQPNEAQNYLHLDWKHELTELVAKGIKVYGVQCLGKRHATPFYTNMASLTGGIRIELHQFQHVLELIKGICYKQAGPERFAAFEKELADTHKLNRSIAAMLDALAERTKSAYATTFEKVDLQAVDPHRFQVLHVDKDQDIKGFVLATGAAFKKGRGFYEFMKTETIQEKKEVVLVDRTSGDMFSGPKAREMIGLPLGERGRLKPTVMDKFAVYIQSTSVNRKLIGGTKFLYEVEGWSA